MTKVAILGCGPAGMFAAHAVAEAGLKPVIFSKLGRKSHMHGAQYLQSDVPGLTGDPFTIKTILRGTIEGYRAKVYEDPSYVPARIGYFNGEFHGWDIREAYDNAWAKYSRFIQDVDLDDAPWMLDVIEDEYDYVVSTIPAKLLCRNPEHEFTTAKIWSTDYIKAEQSEFQGPGDTWLDNIVVYSGDPDDWWVRQSRIHGWENTEFPASRRPKNFQGKLFEVDKPLSTTCDCFPTFHREGRYGRWEKGVLSQEGYDHTKEHLEKVSAR